jgi:hypothetical protein
MQKCIVFFILSLAILTISCSEERDLSSLAPTGPDESSQVVAAEALAWEFVKQAGWAVEVAQEDLAAAGVAQRRHGCWPVFGFERTVVSGDIVHYSAIVSTGPGPYDQIGIHRVVRERRPYRPIRTRKTLFMLHGDLKEFSTMFIPGQFSSTLPNDFGIAVFLAENDVDVWGIDQGWNLVPAEETDFSFFADWGIQKEVDHLDFGIRIARIARLLTGNGYKKLNLLGYSSGSATGYALLNQETQEPNGHRQVKGYIAADLGVRSDDEGWIESNQLLALDQEAAYESGQYEDPLFLADAAILARDYPDDPSPYFEGATNLELALFFGGGLVFEPTEAHYHAPILEAGFPVDFQFVTIDQWLDFLEHTSAYEPLLFELEVSQLCAGYDSPFVEHLGDITVPVFDLGGAGGIAPLTEATLGYLGSDDITQLYVAIGYEDVQLEYGHIDIFTGSNAPELVWQPVLEWIEDHAH